MSRAVLLLVVLAACGNSSSGSGADASVGRDGTTAHDGNRGDAGSGSGRDDAGSGGGSGSNVPDGTPTRQTCTSHFGTALPASPTYGRLDGYLVSIIAPSSMSSCNADSSHVHLQIQMNNEIYDIAIDATDETTNTDDVHTTTLEVAMPGDLPWAEGWHTGLSVDYKTTLGVSSTEMPLDSKAEIVSAINGDLQTANHVSVYTTTYGDDGAHLVHRDGDGHDGLLVTEPLSTPSHLRLFSFSDQTF